jgi:hypothetical protein
MMASEIVPRGRGWKLAVVTLTILFVTFTVNAILDGRHPSGYRGAHTPPGQWAYPTDEVQFSVTAMAIEWAVACVVLIARSRLISIGFRAVLLAAFQACALFFFALMGMHATKPYFDHVLYLFVATAFLVLFAIGTGVAAIVAPANRPAATDISAFD